jgi:threonine dehydratase
MSLPVTIADVQAARERIARFAVVTPLLEHPALNDRVGGRVLLKAENLQRVGAFKFRGAYNAIAQVDRTRFPGGVVACSSGNHAQGVAHAATLSGMPSAIVMPSDAPPLKIARTQAFGAEVITYDRVKEDREAIAADVAAKRRMDFVHPFDDPRVIAGQGTAGLELMEQANAIGAIPDEVLVCCSGGGFLSGVAVAVKAANAATRVTAVEPVGFDRMGRSIRAGAPVENERMSGSICDSLMAKATGRHTFAVAQANVAGGYAITDDEARAAMRFAFTELKLVLEPGGAAALAAILAGKVTSKGRIVAAMLSGGNVDPGLFARTITA